MAAARSCSRASAPTPGMSRSMTKRFMIDLSMLDAPGTEPSSRETISRVR